MNGTHVSPYFQQLTVIVNDTAASDWLRTQVRRLDNRDTLDSARDAEVLAALQRQRCYDMGLGLPRPALDLVILQR